MENQVVYIEVMVGELPEWYEEEFDGTLEQAIENYWQNNPAYEDAAIRVTYGYNGPHLAIAYNEDGDKAFERECDLDSIFQVVYEIEVAPYVATGSA